MKGWHQQSPESKLQAWNSNKTFLVSPTQNTFKSLLRLLPEKQTLKRISYFSLCVCVCMCVKCSMIKGVVYRSVERNYR